MDSLKDAIADAFERHFTLYGFKDTSVDAVARELRISKKTIYQHFASKEEIFYFVVYRSGCHLRSEVRERIRVFPTYRARVAEMVRLAFRDFAAHHAPQPAPGHRLDLQARTRQEIVQTATSDAFRELIHELVVQGQAAGEFLNIPAVILEQFVHGILAQAVAIRTEQPELQAEEEAARAVLKLLICECPEV
ncbi:MAG: TetR/AcrR family transcriptional regulator [Anaerolineae bacterium]|nr:TetR/AcrR family transcriptional regulator [Anaerolineae bacterium]